MKASIHEDVVKLEFQGVNGSDMAKQVYEGMLKPMMVSIRDDLGQDYLVEFAQGVAAIMAAVMDKEFGRDGLHQWKESLLLIIEQFEQEHPPQESRQ